MSRPKEMTDSSHLTSKSKRTKHKSKTKDKNGRIKQKVIIEEANHDIDIFAAELPKSIGMWGHHQLQEHAFPWETDHCYHPPHSPWSFFLNAEQSIHKLKQPTTKQTELLIKASCFYGSETKTQKKNLQ